MFLRRLNLDDARDHAIASALFLGAPEYELDAFGRLPSPDTAQPLEGRFPSACAPEHRVTFCAFDHDQAIGLAQIALHMPSANSAALLLLLVPAPLRKQHVGCEIVERLSRQARRWPGISNWYLSVTDTNIGGLAFWRHCGFRTVATGLTAPGISHRLLGMSRPIKARPACQHHGAQEDSAGVDARNLFARLG